MSGRGAGGRGDTGATALRSLNVEWQPGRRVTARLEAPTGEGKVGILLTCHRAAARALAARVGAVVLAGKSMGGRVGTHLAAGGEPCSAVVCYGYPLLPPGRESPRDTAHLSAVTVPLLCSGGLAGPPGAARPAAPGGRRAAAVHPAGP